MCFWAHTLYSWGQGSLTTWRKIPCPSPSWWQTFALARHGASRWDAQNPKSSVKNGRKWGHPWENLETREAPEDMPHPAGKARSFWLWLWTFEGNWGANGVKWSGNSSFSFFWKSSSFHSKIQVLNWLVMLSWVCICVCGRLIQKPVLAFQNHHSIGENLSMNARPSRIGSEAWWKLGMFIQKVCYYL